MGGKLQSFFQSCCCCCCCWYKVRELHADCKIFHFSHKLNKKRLSEKQRGRRSRMAPTQHLIFWALPYVQFSTFWLFVHIEFYVHFRAPHVKKKLLVVSCGEENCSRNCNIGFRDIGLNAAETWLMPPVFFVTTACMWPKYFTHFSLVICKNSLSYKTFTCISQKHFSYIRNLKIWSKFM